MKPVGWSVKAGEKYVGSASKPILKSADAAALGAVLAAALAAELGAAMGAETGTAVRAGQETRRCAHGGFTASLPRSPPVRAGRRWLGAAVRNVRSRPRGRDRAQHDDRASEVVRAGRPGGGVHGGECPLYTSDDADDLL